MPSADQGKRIGPYRILRPLGRGGVGVVSLCEHTELGSIRAVKVLAEAAGDQGALSRFRREAQVAGELDHPHILKAEHYDIDALGRPYIVMPYVGDEVGPLDLERLLAEEGGKLPPDLAARLTRQILEGLGHAHRLGLVHRDLKPRNVLIERSAGGVQARIADFGLVRVLGDAAFRERLNQSISQSIHGPKLAPDEYSRTLPVREPGMAPDDYSQTIREGQEAGTSTASLIGTWSYMAPEQRTGAEADARSDLYAAGLLAYRMLMGKLPTATSGMPGDRDPKLHAWDGWLRRMLADEPGERFGSAEAALAEFPGGGAKARSTAGLLAAVLAVVLLGVGGVWLAGLGRGGPPRQQESAAQGVDPAANQPPQQTETALPPPPETEPVVEDQPPAPRYTSATEVNMVKAVVLGLRKRPPQFASHPSIKAELDAADIQEQLATDSWGVDWEAAGAAYEAEREVLTKAVSLDAAAQKADEARIAYESVERPSPLYDAVREEWDAADAEAAEATAKWDAGAFEEAHALWAPLADKLEPLLPRHQTARSAADEARAAYVALEKPDPLYSAVREQWDDADREAQKATARFALGAFDESAESWRQATSSLGTLLAEHQGALAAAQTARDRWEAHDAAPSPWLDDASVRAARSAAESAGSQGERQLASGDFDGARRSFESALNSWNDALSKHNAGVAALLARARDGNATKERRREAVEAYLRYKPDDAAGKQEQERILALLGPKIGDTKLVSLGNGVTATLVWVPPGSFRMGSPSTEAGRDDDEGPQRTVTFAEGFWLCETEVTQGQWKAVMDGKNPSRFTGDDNRPVEQVSWDDCQEFLRRLQQRGINARLPSEAEWEYACRAGTTTPYSFGLTISTDQANYDGNYTYGSGRKGVYRKQTTRVKTFPANAWGLYDMHGNVWEWCEDVWHEDYSGNPPKDGSAWLTGGDNTRRVLRGGSWINIPGNLRSATRYRITPGNRNNHFGFRFALD